MEVTQSDLHLGFYPSNELGSLSAKRVNLTSGIERRVSPISLISKNSKIGSKARNIGMPICVGNIPLRKHAYSNIQKISHPKTENFQINSMIFFFIYLLNT